MDPEVALKNAIEKRGRDQAEAVQALLSWLCHGGDVPEGLRWPNLFLSDAAVWAARAWMYEDYAGSRMEEDMERCYSVIGRRMDAAMDPKVVVA